MYLEILTCRTMQHPNVLTIAGVPRNLASLSVVTPWLRNGTVHDYLDKLSATYSVTPIWLLNKWVRAVPIDWYCKADSGGSIDKQYCQRSSLLARGRYGSRRSTRGTYSLSYSAPNLLTVIFRSTSSLTTMKSLASPTLVSPFTPTATAKTTRRCGRATFSGRRQKCCAPETAG